MLLAAYLGSHLSVYVLARTGEEIAIQIHIGTSQQATQHLKQVWMRNLVLYGVVCAECRKASMQDGM